MPFESTGEGSTFCGYGLGGGASVSEGPDNLHTDVRLCHARSGCATHLFSAMLYALKGTGDLGESEYGEKFGDSTAVGEDMSGLLSAMFHAQDGIRVVGAAALRRAREEA